MEKSKVIEKLFFYIVTYSYLILPILYLTTRPKKIEAKIIALYGVIAFLLLFFYFDIPIEYNKLWNTLFTFCEYTFFAILFYIGLKTPRFKKLVAFLSIAFYVFQVIHYFTIVNSRIDSIPIGVESILMFVYIFLFFYESMKSTRQDFIYTIPQFWISVGLLIYLGGSFFINILANSLPREEVLKYWYLNYIADTCKTILFAIGLIYLMKLSHRDEKKSSAVPLLDII